MTKEQLNEIQRLNAVRVALPFSFLAVGAAVIFILTNDDLPLLSSVAVSVIAVALSVYVIVAMTKRIGEILNTAPVEAALPARIPPSAFFVGLLHSTSDLNLLAGKWFWACMCIAAIVVPPAKYLRSENISWAEALGMFPFAIFSYVVFRAFSAERRRRRTVAGADKT